jgi:hypothetical protein
MDKARLSISSSMKQKSGKQYKVKKIVNQYLQLSKVHTSIISEGGERERGRKRERKRYKATLQQIIGDSRMDWTHHNIHRRECPPSVGGRRGPWGPLLRRRRSQEPCHRH